MALPVLSVALAGLLRGAASHESYTTVRVAGTSDMKTLALSKCSAAEPIFIVSATFGSRTAHFTRTCTTGWCRARAQLHTPLLAMRYFFDRVL
jgi:hypothetical protein